MKFKITLMTLFISAIAFCQTENTKNTVDNQFRTLYKNSNNYQEYKVIPKKAYGILHNNVLDSLQVFNKELTTKNSLINSQKNTIGTLEKEATITTTKLQEAIAKETSISVFGFQLQKNIYSIILYSIIALLLAATFFFIYKFKNSNVVTSESKSNLEDVENEFNVFRKKALEREQKLRRELQDEINKNRNN
jgi:hypothetical protein